MLYFLCLVNVFTLLLLFYLSVLVHVSAIRFFGFGERLKVDIRPWSVPLPFLLLNVMVAAL